MIANRPSRVEVCNFLRLQLFGPHPSVQAERRKALSLTKKEAARNLGATAHSHPFLMKVSAEVQICTAIPMFQVQRLLQQNGRSHHRLICTEIPMFQAQRFHRQKGYYHLDNA